jgi:hypothetical protein
MVLIIQHNEAGFFSCCSVALTSIIEFINNNKKLPVSVDTRGLFTIYKPDSDLDITYDFYNKPSILNYEYKGYVSFHHENQFKAYSLLDYYNIIPIFKLYFQPSFRIISLSDSLIQKYKIDVDNCIALYYRGTDKFSETAIDSFDSFYLKLQEIIELNKDESIQVLIQTDTSQFIDYLSIKPLFNKCIIISEIQPSYTLRGIHNERTSIQNYNDISILLAVTLIISKCKYIISSSGNVSLFFLLNRGGSNNVWQNLNCIWYN